MLQVTIARKDIAAETAVIQGWATADLLRLAGAAVRLIVDRAPPGFDEREFQRKPVERREADACEHGLDVLALVDGVAMLARLDASDQWDDRFESNETTALVTPEEGYRLVDDPHQMRPIEGRIVSFVRDSGDVPAL